MKYNHTLTVNSIGNICKEYHYSFGKTKNITIKVCESGFEICADLSKRIDIDSVLKENAYLFPDGIRKGLLVYILTFSKCLMIDSICLNVDGKEYMELFTEASRPFVFSMIEGDLIRTIPSSFTSEPAINTVLHTTKTQYNQLTAALFAYLYSQSKNLETERFIYLWTAFNGIYGWLSNYIARANGVNLEKYEYKQIIGIQKYLSIGAQTINRNEQTRVACIVKDIISKHDIHKRSDIEQNELANRISQVLTNNDGTKYNLTPYGYMLTQFSYYYRCKLVHGNRPILLFSYSDDKDLHSLCVINSLLIEFIEEYLPLFLDKAYVEKTVIPKTEAIELS